MLEDSQKLNLGKYSISYNSTNIILLAFLLQIIICYISAGEPQIIDYQTQQHKLFPVIASALAYRFAAIWLWDVYNEVTSQLEQGDLESLPEVILL